MVEIARNEISQSKNSKEKQKQIHAIFRPMKYEMKMIWVSDSNSNNFSQQ